MTRKEISNKVKQMMNRNSQIDSFFEPIIEEFFIRLVEKFNFNEQELDENLNKYGALDSMVWINTKGIEKGEVGFFDFTVHYDDSDKMIMINNKQIKISVEYLKSILLGDKNEIENCINTAFHEQGHFIQLLIQDDSYYIGLLKCTIKKEDDDFICYGQGCSINEFAEIINAYRLTKRKSKSKKILWI